MIARVGRWLAAGALLAVAVVGVLSMMPPAEARPPCLCPDVFAPVICSNGMTYSNSCVASCNGATGCHRTGDI